MYIDHVQWGSHGPCIEFPWTMYVACMEARGLSTRVLLSFQTCSKVCHEQILKIIPAV